MDGIFEEPAIALGFRDWADLAALGDSAFDVVTAVETGRRLIDQAEEDCLADDYTADVSGSAAFFGMLGGVIVAVLMCSASLLILASGWTL